MNFASDNVTSASPEILAALTAANDGSVASYGADDLTQRVEDRLKEIFETDLAVMPVATGTAANALSFAMLSPSWGAVYCHKDSHAAMDECGAPEFYTGGSKVVGLAGEHGKLTADHLADVLAFSGKGVVHHSQASVVTVTQSTEAGTCYRPDEVAAIAAVARRNGMGMHMDGTRFANALVSLNASPADLTWRAGVEILSLGATKNGALAAEAVVVFDRKRAPELAFRCKQGGHLLSKMRFLSAQLCAYLEDNLWLRNARHANAVARVLGDGLAAVPGVKVVHPVEANEVFARMPEETVRGLTDEGFRFFRFGERQSLVRLVAAHNTREADARAFIAAARRHTKKLSHAVA